MLNVDIFFICFILTKKNAFDKILPIDITELKCSNFDLVDHKFCLISYNIFCVYVISKSWKKIHQLDTQHKAVCRVP